jgi:hypothetical protein
VSDHEASTPDLRGAWILASFWMGPTLTSGVKFSFCLVLAEIKTSKNPSHRNSDTTFLTLKAYQVGMEVVGYSMVFF